MNIEKFINKLCPARNEDSDSGIHDRSYARALAGAHAVFSGCSLNRLEMHLELARESYRFDGNSHTNTARCVILYELINEAKKELDNSE